MISFWWLYPQFILFFYDPAWIANETATFIVADTVFDDVTVILMQILIGKMYIEWIEFDKTKTKKKQQQRVNTQR